MLVPGEVVYMAQHSKRSYFLFRKYQKRIPNLICGCRLRHDVPLVVDSSFADGSVILLTREEPPRVAIAYVHDLEPMYEAN